MINEYLCKILDLDPKSWPKKDKQRKKWINLNGINGYLIFSDIKRNLNVNDIYIFNLTKSTYLTRSDTWRITAIIYFSKSILLKVYKKDNFFFANLLTSKNSVFFRVYVYRQYSQNKFR